MKLEDFKILMGDQYKFTAEYPIEVIRESIRENNEDYYGKVPYVMEAGNVDIEVEILGEENDDMYADYNICVKIDAFNWRTYDTLPEIVNFDVPDIEAEMFRLLDKFVTENNLSYTQYNGQQFEERMRNFEPHSRGRKQEFVSEELSIEKQFQDKIFDNFKSFKEQWSQLSIDEIVNIANEISVTEQVYHSLQAGSWGADYEKSFLRFKNPLEVVRDQYMIEQKMSGTADMGTVLWTILDTPGIEEAYPLDENYSPPDQSPSMSM